MPHQCTSCGRVFDDGSTEMLSGCPDCGGNKFQFRPDGVDQSHDQPSEPPEPPEPPTPEGTMARTVGKTAVTVRDLVGSGGEPLDRPSGDLSEDAAQASARSEIVGTDDLPSSPTGASEHRFRPVDVDDTADTGEGGPAEFDGDSGDSDENGADAEADARADAADERAVDRPDLAELREELNDQFESIKVVEPGQYELNLMELYDRNEYIIALQEDGKYSIQVPETVRE